jgi:hypothetical protein
MKYEVKTKFVFEGSFFTEADNAAQAKEFVHQHCGLVIGGDIYSALSPDEVDWDFSIHPEKIIGRTRRIIR